MEKIDLDESLRFINNPAGQLEIVLYAELKNNLGIKMLDIEQEALPDLLNMYITSINSNIIEKDQHTILPISNADERRNCFFEFDLPIPDELNVIQNLIGNDNIDNFDFEIDDLYLIDTLLIVIADNENEIVLYKHISPVEILGRGRKFFIKSNQRLEKLDQPILSFTSGFHAIFVNQSLFILDLKLLERNLGFNQVITNEANTSLTLIEGMNLINNIDSLKELLTDISFARKLVGAVKNSPVIKEGITNAQIIEFAKNHPLTKKKMRFSEDGNQFSLDTKVSKIMFVKILNDDLLSSELTQLYYDSLAKDGIKIDNDEDAEIIEN